LNTSGVPSCLKNNSNFPFWVSMLSESRSLFNLDALSSVLDFGCGNGGFLGLINHYSPGLELVGAEISKTLLAEASFQYKNCKNISFVDSSGLKQYIAGYFDVVYSQEVIYTLPDLKVHANQIFNLLKPRGYYLLTIGCHVDNPTWNYRNLRIAETEAFPVHNYSIEDVSRAFYKAGFRVLLKRLPVTYPLKYVPDESDPEFENLNDLIISSEQYKFLFVFLKPEKGVNNG